MAPIIKSLLFQFFTELKYGFELDSHLFDFSLLIVAFFDGLLLEEVKPDHFHGHLVLLVQVAAILEEADDILLDILEAGLFMLRLDIGLDGGRGGPDDGPVHALEKGVALHLGSPVGPQPLGLVPV
jgi:hypothetical protein